jgi:FHA domain
MRNPTIIGACGHYPVTVWQLVGLPFVLQNPIFFHRLFLLRDIFAESPTVARHMKRQFSVGRDPGCDIRIADDSVSRVHADLTLTEDGGLLVRDRGSRNGTRLIRGGRSVPIGDAPLRASDEVEFGEARLTAGDLISALRQKFPIASPPAAPVAVGAKPAPAAPQPLQPAQPAASPSPAKLVRCVCGAIKPAQQLCPECSQ